MDWQQFRLSTAENQTANATLAAVLRFAFVGITEHFRLSLCLFYYTFQVNL